jgi:hypothetical protein
LAVVTHSVAIGCSSCKIHLNYASFEARRSIADHPELYPPLYFAATRLLELNSSEKIAILAIFCKIPSSQSQSGMARAIR